MPEPPKQAAPEQQEQDGSADSGFGAVFGRLGSAAWLGVVWAILPAAGGFVLLANMKPVSEWLATLGDGGSAVYVGIFALSAGFALLPTYAQATLGGYAFGPVVGTIAALAGFVGASLIGRLLAKRITGDRVDQEIRRHKQAEVVRDALVNSGAARRFGIVTLLRVPPNSPFALTNLLLSTTGVPLVTYVCATAIGMLPRTAAAVMIGHQITDFSDQPDKPKWLIFGGIGVTIVVVIVIGHIATRALRRVTNGARTTGEIGDAE